MAIRLVLLFVPDVSEAIWNFVSCFHLTPRRLYGICHLFVCLLDAPGGYMAYVVLSSFRLTPTRPHGVYFVCICLMLMWLYDSSCFVSFFLMPT